MLAKIVNNQTKEVQVATGTNTSFYEAHGFTEMEVEQAYNGSWYVKGYAPQESDEEKKAKRRAGIIRELSEIDLKTVRPLRAIQSGAGTQDDIDMLSTLEQQAEELRAELKNLEVK